MPALWELPQQIPGARAKARTQKSQGGGKFLVQIPWVRGVGGVGVVLDEIDTCINSQTDEPLSRTLSQTCYGFDSSGKFRTFIYFNFGVLLLEN